MQLKLPMRIIIKIGLQLIVCNVYITGEREYMKLFLTISTFVDAVRQLPKIECIVMVPDGKMNIFFSKTKVFFMKNRLFIK